MGTRQCVRMCCCIACFHESGVVYGSSRWFVDAGPRIRRSGSCLYTHRLPHLPPCAESVEQMLWWFGGIEEQVEVEPGRVGFDGRWAAAGQSRHGVMPRFFDASNVDRAASQSLIDPHTIFLRTEFSMPVKFHFIRYLVPKPLTSTRMVRRGV